MVTAAASDRSESRSPLTPDERLSSALDRLLARARLEGILGHDLGLFAAQRARRAGAPLDGALVRQERSARLGAATVPPLLRRIRESCEGPLVLFKGAELACRYPAGRRFADVDLLTPQAAEIQKTLLAAGFVVDEDGLVGPHHLPPVLWPTLPLQTEIHHAVKWPAGLRPPDAAEIVAAAVPSRLGIEGILAPRPAHHALILTAHAWSHRPLTSLRDLVDIAVLGTEAEPGEIEAVAAAWSLTPIWRTTRAAIDGVFFGGRRTFPLRTWARHLPAVRDRTVFESHLERWLADYSGRPLGRALLNTPRVVQSEFGLAPDDTWGEKLTRSFAALRHPSMALSRHDADYADRARDAHLRDQAPDGAARTAKEDTRHGAQRLP